MDDVIRKLADLGIGLVSLSKEKVEQKVREWTGDSTLSSPESKRLVAQLVSRGEQERVELQRMVQEQVQRTLSKLGLGSVDDAAEVTTIDQQLAALSARVSELEQKLGLTAQQDDAPNVEATDTPGEVQDHSSF